MVVNPKTLPTILRFEFLIRDVSPFEDVSALKWDLSNLQQELADLKNLIQDLYNISPTEIQDAAFTTLEGLTNSKHYSLSQELSDLKGIESQFELFAKKQSSSCSSATEKDVVEETSTAETKTVQDLQEWAMESNSKAPAYSSRPCTENLASRCDTDGRECCGFADGRDNGK
jgi:hypothetical protein